LSHLGKYFDQWGLRLDEMPVLKAVVKKFRKHGWCIEIKHDANRSAVVTALWFKSPKIPSKTRMSELSKLTDAQVLLLYHQNK
jgi:hypothetical protein